MVLDFNLTLFSFVFMRMCGCILFNPIFGRKNLPVILKIGMALLLSLFAYATIPDKVIEISSIIVYCVMLVKELLVGFIVGYIIQLFMSVFIISGEVIDFQMGIAMANMYDPQSNISMPVTASIMNCMYMLLFFAANAHITMIKIFCQLATISPYGNISFSSGIFEELIGLFSIILVYAVKLALPILAVELIVEMGVGLLMKAVPQINVFIVNIQLKILIGFIAILVLVPSLSSFLELMTTKMFDEIQLIFGI